MDASERLLDLVSFLLAARHPVPAVDIYDAFASEYGGTPQARERKFSRDKDQLRELGIPLVRASATDEDETGGYFIDRNAFYLPDVALTSDERVAAFAVGSAALAGAFPLRTELAHALTKLRTVQDDGAERAQPFIITRGQRRAEVEETITRAVAGRRRLSIRYGSDRRARLVDPFAVSVRRNRFTFVGWCHRRKGIRTFHADRVTSCALARPRSSEPDYEVPADFDPLPHLPVHPWQVRVHDPVPVVLEFPPGLARSGPLVLGVKPGEAVPASNMDGLIGEVLALSPAIRIVGPPEARERMLEKLKALRLGARRVA